MSDIMEVIKTRRSIRHYLDKAVDESLIEQVLDAVKWSPSWANEQAWEVVVVKDPAIKEKLAQILLKGNPAKKAMTEAPVIFVMCSRLEKSGFYKNVVTTKFGDWFMFDLGIATQSLCLAAHSLGLGTVITGLFEHDKAKEILNVPAGCELVSMVPMGYAAKDSKAPKRREISEFSHTDSF